MSRALYVLPECFIDTNLIEYLLNEKVNHQHCCSKVVGQLKTTFNQKFAIGIIDKDKVELGYIRECEPIASSSHLCLMKHTAKHQYLITVSPAMDKFILDCAQDLNIDLTTYSIPSALIDFTKLSKSVTSNRDARFKALFMDIKSHKEIRTLKNVLSYLCENRYSSSIEVMKTMFESDKF